MPIITILGKRDYRLYNLPISEFINTNVFAVYSTEEMSSEPSEPTESQITVIIEEFFKDTVTWSLIKFLQYRKKVDDFTYSKRQEHRLYRSALKALSGDQAETCLLNFEDEKSSEIVKNFWILIDKERSKHEIENIQLDYTKRVLNDTNNETHQIRTMATNNAIKTLKHVLEDDESNREKKKKPVSGTSPNLRDQHEKDRPRTPENNLQSGMVLRKTKKVRYTESLSSDSDDYVEGSKYKSARSKRYVREEDNSRESTPCPTTSTITNTLIITPNKPIVTSATFNQYSAHIICAFNATIHLVKQITEKKLYEEIETALQTRNKLVLKDFILKKLRAIFQSDYSEIFSKIIKETATEKDNETTEESKFLFFIRHTLLDFVAMFKYLTPKVLDRDMKERSYIVECLSPILRAFRNAFPEIKYEWIEKDVESIKKVNEIFMSNIGRRKTDLLVLRLSDASELLMVEVSGPPHKSTKRHTVGDAKKLLIMAVCSLCRILANNLDCPINDAKKVRTYSIQAVGDRITLFAISLAEKKKYLAIELASCVVPFSYEAITCYTKIFNFFAIIRNEFIEQEKVQRKIRSFIPSADNTEDLREWLHLPDDDLTPVTDDDMDELFL